MILYDVFAIKCSLDTDLDAFNPKTTATTSLSIPCIFCFFTFSVSLKMSKIINFMCFEQNLNPG